MNATFADIKEDMLLTNDTDVFYTDGLNNVDYHLHLLGNGRPVFMKKEKNHIVAIDESEGIKAVNEKCHLCSIGEDSYFGTLYAVGSPLAEFMNRIDEMAKEG